MKKKIWALCLTFVLAMATFALSGCTLFGDVGKIEWVKQPAKVYSLNDTSGLSFEFVVELKKDGTKKTIKYPGEYDKDITISNFTTSSVGQRNATVTYEKLTLSFAYKVVDGKYADGTGSAADPYVITTTTHFQNMLNEKAFHYYKLADSLDFTGKTIYMANAGQDATNAEAWVGELDGANYTVSGISEVRTHDNKAINKYNEIFGRVGRETEKFALKNITFDFASTGKSATMGLVTSNAVNGVLEFDNVKVTGYLDASSSGNSNISPYVSFLQRSMPGSVAAPLKSLTLNNCVNDIKILNAYATSLVAGFASAQSVLPVGSVKFTNCKFAGLIEGSYQQGAGAFFANNNTAKDYYVFSGCSVDTSAKIIKTAGRGLDNSTATVYNCGNVCLQGETEVNGITGTINVDDTLKAVNIKVDGLNLECSVDGEVADDFKIYAVGSMDYGNGKGGAFRYVQPAVKSNITDGKLTQTLLKIKSDATKETANNDSTYGSDLIVLDGGVLTYYCGTVCQSINVTQAKLVVVAYKDGKAIAIGTRKDSVNLAA